MKPGPLYIGMAINTNVFWY